MTAFRARVGRVRMKSGGADVVVLDRQIDNGNGEDWRGSILANARRVADQATPAEPLAGYIVLGLYGDGTASLGYRYDPQSCPVPRALLPAWVAEIIRRDLITDNEARSIFDEKFEWQDGA